MDDMVAKLSAMLNDPKSLNQIQQVVQSLTGGQNGQNTAPNPGPPPAQQGPDVAQMLQSAMTPATAGPGSNEKKPGNQNPMPADMLKGLLPGIDIATLIKIQRALSTVDNDDKNIQLLRALRPHLTRQREGRIDEAMRIMQLIHILPMLKESGLFGGEKR